VKQDIINEFEDDRRQASKAITSFVSHMPQWENMTVSKSENEEATVTRRESARVWATFLSEKTVKKKFLEIKIIPQNQVIVPLQHS